jgi:hypothetical protein
MCETEGSQQPSAPCLRADEPTVGYNHIAIVFDFFAAQETCTSNAPSQPVLLRLVLPKKWLGRDFRTL